MYERQHFPLPYFPGEELLLCLDSTGLGFLCVLQHKNGTGANNAGGFTVERTKRFLQETTKRYGKEKERVEERNRGRHDPQWVWKNRSLRQILGYVGHVIHGFPFVVLFVESLVKI